MTPTVDPTFWRGKRVLITGHTGFKGGWLSLWLQSLNTELQGLALEAPTSPSLFVEADVGVGMNSTIGDIRDFEVVRSCLVAFKPEIIIHMAAQPLVRLSYAEPVSTYATNVMGTVHVLEAARSVGGVRAIVNVTTDKCYENREWPWGYRENEPMGGYDPYSSSKGCSELVTAAYRNSYFNSTTYAQHGVALASARAGNVVGGGDWAPDRLIPDILGAIARGDPVRIRHPKAVRPWQHVLEPLRGYLALAEHLYNNGPDFAEAWNFGPNDEDSRDVAWIATKMCELWGAKAEWLIDSQLHPHEAHQLKLDISKARARLNWYPKLNLLDALDRVVDWSKQWHSGADMRRTTLAQIFEYQKLAESTEVTQTK